MSQPAQPAAATATASQTPQRQMEAQTITTSRTVTQTLQPQTVQDAPRILRLRGAGNVGDRSVRWAEDVIDNEGLGRKSSKVCCIYHKPKDVNESSDESSSDSSSDSDSDSDNDNDNDRARPTNKGKNGCGHGHNHGNCGGKGGKRDGKRKRRPSPNAYERVPKPRPTSGQQGPSTAKEK